MRKIDEVYTIEIKPGYGGAVTVTTYNKITKKEVHEKWVYEPGFLEGIFGITWEDKIKHAIEKAEGWCTSHLDSEDKLENICKKITNERNDKMQKLVDLADVPDNEKD